MSVFYGKAVAVQSRTNGKNLYGFGDRVTGVVEKLVVLLLFFRSVEKVTKRIASSSTRSVLIK